MFKRIVVMVALVAMVFQQNVAHAQALAVLEPVFNGVVNRAIGAGILANLERRGLVTAANDAVFQSTMKWVGQAANDASYASAAAGAVASVAGAPVWLTAAVSVGALVAAGAVAWGAYQLTQTGTDSAPTLTLTPDVASPPSGASSPGGASSPSGGGSTSPGVPEVPSEGGVYSGYDYLGNSYNYQGMPGLPSSFPYYVQSYFTPKAVSGCSSARDCAVAMANYDASQFCSMHPGYSGCIAVTDGQPSSYQTDGKGNQMPVYAATVSYIDNGQTCYGVPDASGVAAVIPCQATTSFGYTTVVNPLYQTPQAVTGRLADLPVSSDMLTSPVPSQLTAQLADRLWQKASAMPGYDGAPYQAVNPVSSADVSAAAAPQWSDLVEGTPKAPGDSSVTIAPDYYPVPSGGSGGSPTSSQCDLNSQLAGCVPLGSAPASGSIPTSDASISLTPWNIGSVDGTCPAPQTVAILGTDFQLTFDPLCSVVQKLRPLILALCALAAAYIVAMGVAL